MRAMAGKGGTRGFPKTPKPLLTHELIVAAAGGILGDTVHRVLADEREDKRRLFKAIHDAAVPIVGCRQGEGSGGGGDKGAGQSQSSLNTCGEGLEIKEAVALQMCRQALHELAHSLKQVRSQKTESAVPPTRWAETEGACKASERSCTVPFPSGFSKGWRGPSDHMR